MTEPDEVGWRIRSGCGLLLHAPLSAELVEAHRKEDEKERAQAAAAAELRAQAAAEHAAELRFKGVQPRSREELFEQVSDAQDRADRVEARRQREADEYWGRRVTGRPTATTLLAASKAAREARVAAAAAKPVTAGEFAKVKERLLGVERSVNEL